MFPLGIPQLICIVLTVLPLISNDALMNTVCAYHLLEIQAQQQTAADLLAMARLPVLYPHSFRIKRCEWYRKPRSEAMYADIIMGTWTCADFRTHFRVTKPSFNYLCAVLEPYLVGKNKKAVPVQIKVAVGLWKLAREVYHYNDLASVFPIAPSTANKIFYKFVRAVILVS
jgi:hypothetical protein